MQLISRAMLSSSAILVLTILHHFYGAVIYSTPWRAHVAFFAGPVLVALALAWLINRSWATLALGTIAKWTFVVLAGLVSFGMFGMYEGGYNHFLKDILYFGGMPSETLRAMFPAPAYEMPNDFVFEVTGVAQFFVGLWAGYDLYRVIRPWRDLSSSATTGSAHLGNTAQSV